MSFVDDNTGKIIYEVSMYAKEEPGADGNRVWSADGSLDKNGDFKNAPSKAPVKAYIRDSEAKRQAIKSSLGGGKSKFSSMSDEDFYNDFFIAPLGKGSSSITARQKSALDAFANKYRRQPTASERQQILKKYQ